MLGGSESLEFQDSQNYTVRLLSQKEKGRKEGRNKFKFSSLVGYLPCMHEDLISVPTMSSKKYEIKIEYHININRSSVLFILCVWRMPLKACPCVCTLCACLWLQEMSFCK